MQFRPLLTFGAVPEEQVNQVLIRHVQIRRELFEVADGRRVKPDGHLALEAADVWVLAGLCEVVFGSHLKLQ